MATEDNNRWVVYPTDKETKRWEDAIKKKGLKGHSDLIRTAANLYCNILEDPKPVYVVVK